MKNELLYIAKAIKIGKIAKTESDYYIDILEPNGNQQTVATGSLKYVKSYISKIVFV